MSMRKRISLYIASQLVDLDDQSFILLNYTQEDLNNPAAVHNSFSKKLVLKGSPINNKIFGDIFRMDRKTLYGTKFLGSYFDPARRTPFTIYNEMNEVLESGYIKIDNVVKDGVSIEYHITLYGGLGSFFYGLTYSEKGEKKSLADLRYMAADGSYTTIPGHFGQDGGYKMVEEAWKYLETPSSSSSCWWANIINFAPCYNGLPEEFSADKMVVAPGYYNNIPQSISKDGKTYGQMSGASSYLVKFAKSHTEWEMKDLRWYLQRPIFRIKALFDAICDKQNNGGFDVILSPTFFNQSNKLYWDGWMTLPLISASDRKKADALVKLLSASLTPADYLISFAKIFGLAFLCKEKKVEIMMRSEFYQQDNIIDLTKRVNTRTINITPLLAQTRFYEFGNDAIGEWAKRYKEDYGRAYAIQRVNTGNNFNSETTNITKDIVFKDAVDVQEKSLLFYSPSYNLDDGNYQDIGFSMPQFEETSVILWNGDDSIEHPITNANGYRFPDNSEYPGADWLPKVQLHEADNKSVNGENVLLVFNGMKQADPWFEEEGVSSNIAYRLSDDSSDMQSLNEGKACWNFSSINSKNIVKLPSFRRSVTHMEGDRDAVEKIDMTFEWGEPFARAIENIEMEGDTIYQQYWQKYQTDRYDDDTFLLNCKVDLKGLQVNQELMRSFFYYQGAIFVLNKISNHSLTTWDDTECEFVKVQDINNYIG